MRPESQVLLQFSGVIAVDKPKGRTSTDIVNRLKQILRRESGQKIRVGHAGTLDPLATGVLLVCCGLATRIVPWLHEHSKSYLAGFTLGGTSDTDDCEGNVTPARFVGPVEEAAARIAIEKFRGEISQVPPRFSAVHVGGKRAYKLARRGEHIELAPRIVTIHEIGLVDFSWPTLHINIVCSSGTYVRSIARDLGEALGCGGYMHSLVRTAIGPFLLESCAKVEQLEAGEIQSHIRPIIEAFPGVPQLTGDEGMMTRLRDGKSVNLPDIDSPRVLVVTGDGSFVATLEMSTSDSGEYIPRLNWAPLRFAAK